jgi:septal ring factor EnvC (AmiA/AmiB activator)
MPTSLPELTATIKLAKGLSKKLTKKNLDSFEEYASVAVSHLGKGFGSKIMALKKIMESKDTDKKAAKLVEKKEKLDAALDALVQKLNDKKEKLVLKEKMKKEAEKAKAQALKEKEAAKKAAAKAKAAKKAAAEKAKGKKVKKPRAKKVKTPVAEEASYMWGGEYEDDEESNLDF